MQAQAQHCAPQIRTVSEIGNEKLIRVGDLHWVVTHPAEDQWRVYCVAQFPHVGSNTKRVYPFVKGGISLANTSTWEELQAVLLDKSRNFLH